MEDALPDRCDPEVENRVRESFGEQAFMRTLGARLTGIAPGRVTIELEPVTELSQQNGYAHAGVVTSIADSACGYAAFTLMPANSDVVSVEFKVNLLRPAVGELLLAEARVIRAGRSITVCSADVFTLTAGERRQVALMTGTMMRIPG
jgi:uncharacterized protein (TIGR00369 family)